MSQSLSAIGIPFRMAVAAMLCCFMVIGCGGKGGPSTPDLDAAGADPATGGTAPATGGSMEAGSVCGNRPGGISTGPGELPYLEDEVLVVLHEPYQTEFSLSIMAGWPLAPRQVIPCRWGTIFRMEITDGTPVEDMTARLRQDPRVRIAEPNFILYFDEKPYRPNDPLWERDDPGDDPRDNVYDQWGPAKIGASIVWNESNGDEGVVVAVLDTGVMNIHEDLEDIIWINVDEDPDNDEDDDGNGWVDDWWGWNCVEHNNYPYDTGAYAQYHGSACSGVVAACQDNERGLSGVAPGVKIMALRVDLSGTGGLVSTVCEALDYAAKNDADVCSMSFGTSSYSEILEVAVDDAWDNGNGPILMASAGNYDSTSPHYPSYYESVMAIGATVPFSSSYNPIDEARISHSIGYYWGSNYGSHLTVMGFGDQYTTTYGGHCDGYWDGYSQGFFGGTSCACPMSAGVMALIKTFFPDETGQWYWDRIQDTADDLGVVGFDIQTGHGRCNALRAVHGPDRFADLEDEFGFVECRMPGDQLFDSIHDVPGNPYRDTEDLYKLTVYEDGELEIYLDIFTWGETLDLEVYSDREMTQLAGSSTGANHYNSSFESVTLNVEKDQQYFIRVFSPAEGNSTTYGLKVRNYFDYLSVVGDNLAPGFIHHGGEKIPFLKLTIINGGTATLDELIVSKSGSLPNGRIKKIQLWEDSNHNEQFDQNDGMIAEIDPLGRNRARFHDLDIEWTCDDSLVLFVTADIWPTCEECDIRLSLESYKDVQTVEGLEAPYYEFPIVSDTLIVGSDVDPPEWLSTIGAQSASAKHFAAVLTWNKAVDVISGPAKYNIYYTCSLPFNINNAIKVADVEPLPGDVTDYKYTVTGLMESIQHNFVVRAEDQVGNEERNTVVVSCTPKTGNDPANPAVLAYYSMENPASPSICGHNMLIRDGIHNLAIYDITDPLDLELVGTWDDEPIWGDVLAGDPYAGAATWFQYHMLDISDPTDPFSTSSVQIELGRTSVRLDNWLYVTNDAQDTYPIDTTDPYNLLVYDPLDMDMMGVPLDMEIFGDYIYQTFKTQPLQIYDRTDPSALEFANDIGADYASGLCIDDGVLYVTNESTEALLLFDIVTDPVVPPILGSTIDGPGANPSDLVVIDHYAYVVRSTYGLVVYDCHDPTDPEYIGDLELSSPRDIATDGKFIYVVHHQQGLYVII